jgi:hypothetical protein
MTVLRALGDVRGWLTLLLVGRGREPFFFRGDNLKTYAIRSALLALAAFAVQWGALAYAYLR